MKMLMKLIENEIEGAWEVHRDEVLQRKDVTQEEIEEVERLRPKTLEEVIDYVWGEYQSLVEWNDERHASQIALAAAARILMTVKEFWEKLPKKLKDEISKFLLAQLV